MRGFKIKYAIIVVLALTFMSALASSDDVKKKKKKTPPPPEETQIVVPDPAVVAAQISAHTENQDPTDIHHDPLQEGTETGHSIMLKAGKQILSEKPADLPGGNEPSQTTVKQKICRQLNQASRPNNIKIRDRSLLIPLNDKWNVGPGVAAGGGGKVGFLYKNQPKTSRDDDKDDGDCIPASAAPTHGPVVDIQLGDRINKPRVETNVPANVPSAER